MSDRMRKALHDGGKLTITIEFNYVSGIKYHVHESAFRLDSFGNGEISKEALAVNHQIEHSLLRRGNGEKFLAVLVGGVVHHRTRPVRGERVRLRRERLGGFQPLPGDVLAHAVLGLVTAPGVGRNGEYPHHQDGAQQGRQQTGLSHSATPVSAGAGFWPA